jgi:hypothetical protein
MSSIAFLALTHRATVLGEMILPEAIETASSAPENFLAIVYG